ncbi:MAG: hypothetical protein KA712_00550 [Myxococcales bacterium]|nr:hypothetical protein [Myxococcales bacterium]
MHHLRDSLAYLAFFGLLLTLPTACSETPSAPEILQQALDTNRLYGTRCQENYEGTWIATLAGTWSTCSKFNKAMDNLAPRSFYFNLQNAETRFEDTLDHCGGSCGGIDTVDMLFVSTHGGAWSNPARGTQVMWNRSTRAFSTNMRLGDEDRGLSLYASHSCDILKNDGQLGTRWQSAFDGGLRMIVGSHDKIWFNTSYTTDGERFANNMRNGQLLKDAWKNSLAGNSADNDAAVMTTGANDSDCWNRMDSMTWSNLLSTPRLRDWDWQTWCQLQWDNQ